MKASERIRAGVESERENSRRLELWLFFVLSLVVAPLAYVEELRHWPLAAVGLLIATPMLIVAELRRSRSLGAAAVCRRRRREPMDLNWRR